MSGSGYCELQVDLNTGTKLHKVIIPEVEEAMSGLIPMNKLHSTLMYDASNPDIDPDINSTVYKARVTGVKMLGDPSSRWRSVALVLDSEAIQKRHKELLEKGFKHSYPELLIHVSIAYGENAEVLFPILERLHKEGKFPETVTLCNETWDLCKN